MNSLQKSLQYAFFMLIVPAILGWAMLVAVCKWMKTLPKWDEGHERDGEK